METHHYYLENKLESKKQLIKICNQEEMARFAQFISSIIKPNSTILLNGNLGAGKTYLAKNIISNISNFSVDEISSPTFTIYNEYNSRFGDLYHFDLYRIKKISELENIGFFDYINNNVTIIEWPEMIFKFITKNFIKIELSFDDKNNNDEVRYIKFTTDLNK